MISSRRIPFYYPPAAAPATSGSKLYRGFPTSYEYRVPITVPAANAPASSLSYFPMLISGTFPFLQAGNILGITNYYGYDIGFSLDRAGFYRLPTERELYNPTTGQFIAWVQVPLLAAGTSNTIWMWFKRRMQRDPNLEPIFGATSVWDANYKGVWHLSETGTNPIAYDSTSNANNSISQTWTPSTSGKIHKCGSFDGTSQYITVTAIVFSGAFTFSCWFNADVIGKIVAGKIGSTATYLGEVSSASVTVETDTNTLKTFAVSTINTGSYYLLNVARDSSDVMRVYVNDVESSSGGQTISGNITLGAIGYYGSAAFRWDGRIDEVHASVGLNRSASWIATEYANQNSPATFYQVGCPENVNLHRAWFIPSSGALAPQTYSDTLTLAITAGMSDAAFADLFSVTALPSASSMASGAGMVMPGLVSLATAAQQALDPNLLISGVVALAVSGQITAATAMEMIGAISLSTGAAHTQESTQVMDALISMAVAGQISPSVAMEMMGSVSLVGSAADTESAQAIMGGDVSLAASGQMSDGSNSTMPDALSLPAAAGFSPSVIAELFGSESLQASAALTPASQLIADLSLALAAAASLGQLEGLSSRIYDDLLSFGSTAGIQHSVEFYAREALSLPSLASIGISAGLVANLAAALAVSSTLSAGEASSLNPAISLAAQGALAQALGLYARDTLSLSTSAGITPSSQVVTNLALALAAAAAQGHFGSIGAKDFDDSLTLEISASLNQALVFYANESLTLQSGAGLSFASQMALAARIALDARADIRSLASSVMDALLGMGVSASQAHSARAVFERSLGLGVVAVFDAAGSVGGVLGEVLRAVAVSLNHNYKSSGILSYLADGLNPQYKTERI